MSEIRYDRLNDSYVLISPERLHRPDMTTIREEDQLAVCPFCEGNEAMTPKEIFALRHSDSLANQPQWYTRVVPNLYKAVAIEAPHQHNFGTFESWEGFGAHEVIIDTPEHHVSMSQWSHEESVEWLKTLRARVEDLRRDHRLASISLFKNEGYDAGSTMSHCHTQLIALPLIPKAQRDVYQRSREYFESHHHPLMESIVRDEEDAEVRIIEKVGEFSAFCPYASNYPFEVMIASSQKMESIDALTNERIEALCSLLLSVMRRLNGQLENMAFNLWISTPPLHEDRERSNLYPFYIHILPRLYRFGGFEVNTDMMINPMEPELAAKVLRGENYV